MPTMRWHAPIPRGLHELSRMRVLKVRLNMIGVAFEYVVESRFLSSESYATASLTFETAQTIHETYSFNSVVYSMALRTQITLFTTADNKDIAISMVTMLNDLGYTLISTTTNEPRGGDVSQIVFMADEAKSSAEQHVLAGISERTTLRVSNIQNIDSWTLLDISRSTNLMH